MPLKRTWPFGRRCQEPVSAEPVIARIEQPGRQDIDADCNDPAITAALLRRREGDGTHHAVLAAASNEIRQTASFVEHSIVGLASRFSALATEARTQSTQVSTALAKTDRITTANEDVSMSELTGLLQTTLSQVIEGVLDMSRNAASIADALNEIGGSVGRVESFMTSLNQINDQAKILSLNATIEAARAGDAGRGFAIVASEVRQLSNQTEQLSQAMRVEVGSISGTVRRSRDVVDLVARIDMSDKLAVRQRLELLLEALLQRRDETDTVIRDAAHGSAEIAREISAIVGAFQFQDRSTQRMMHAVDMLQAMDELIDSLRATDPATHGLDDGPAPDRRWLEQLAGSFTMREVTDRFWKCLDGDIETPHPAPAPSPVFEGELELF